MMHMTFYWSTEVTLLFSFWTTDSILDYSFTLLACLIFSAFYQYLDSRRLQFQISVSSPTIGGDSAIRIPLLNQSIASGAGSKWTKSLWLRKSMAALLFAFNSALGYMLMLAVMSFNGGVFIAVVVGLSIGYLLFRFPSPTPAEDQSDSSCACA